MHTNNVNHNKNKIIVKIMRDNNSTAMHTNNVNHNKKNICKNIA